MAVALRERGEFADALRYAESACASAVELNDLELRVRASLEAAILLKMNDRATAGLTHLNWVMGLVRSERREDLEALAWFVARAYVLYVDLAHNLHQVEVEKLLAILDLGEQFVREIGAPHWRDGLLSLRGRILFDLDRPDDALACLEEAVEVSRSARGQSPSFDLHTHLRILADAYREVGRPEDSILIYEQLLERSTPLTKLAALCGLGRAHLAADRADEAVRFAEQALPLTDAMFARQRAAPMGLLVDAYRAAGNAQRASWAADQMMEIARASGSVRARCNALLDRADVALDRGDCDTARSSLQEVMPLAQELDSGTRRTVQQDHVQERLDRLSAQES